MLGEGTFVLTKAMMPRAKRPQSFGKRSLMEAFAYSTLLAQPTTERLKVYMCMLNEHMRKPNSFQLKLNLSKQQYDHVLKLIDHAIEACTELESQSKYNCQTQLVELRARIRGDDKLAVYHQQLKDHRYDDARIALQQARQYFSWLTSVHKVLQGQVRLESLDHVGKNRFVKVRHAPVLFIVRDCVPQFLCQTDNNICPFGTFVTYTHRYKEDLHRVQLTNTPIKTVRRKVPNLHRQCIVGGILLRCHSIWLYACVCVYFYLLIFNFLGGGRHHYIFENDTC
jgi:hypothetical protein